jgi:lysophospholipase L1-like esterase
MVIVLAASGAACGDESGEEGLPSGGSAPSSGPASVPVPGSMAALGDSITQALTVCEGAGDCPEASWSTGIAPGLRSHRQRITDLRGSPPAVYNLAISGSTVSWLESQARQAVAVHADYVTVLIGANDACAPTEDAMTPLDRYQESFERAMDTLVDGLPQARILVVSIPDLARLWSAGKDHPEVRARWRALEICQSMLADAGSNGDQAQQRRARVRDRVAGYNRVMATACQRHPACRWDGNAVFDHDFSLELVSPRDYWHPSMLGQRTLAEISWHAGYWP